MNPYFKIKRISIKGSMVPAVYINFGQKLTIITGGSDSGKTYFYNLIRYLFGVDDFENAGIDEAKGYDRAHVEFSLGETPYSIVRELHNNSEYMLYSGWGDTLEPTSLIQKIIKSSDSKNSFNSIFYEKLKFKKAKVRINNSGGVNNFNLSNVFDFFCIDEIRILTGKSLLLSEQHTDQTKSKSKFKFLLTQRDDASIGLEKPNKKAKVFLKKQVKELIEEISRDLSYPNMTLIEINEQLMSIENQLELVAHEVDTLLESYSEKIILINDIKSEISRSQKRESYLSMLIDRFSMLKECYVSDLQRIDTVSQAAFFLENFAEELCDNCGHAINILSNISYEEYHASCIAEHNKIGLQLNGLTNSIRSNEKELEYIRESISESLTILSAEMEEYEKLHNIDLKNSREKMEELYDLKEVLLADYSKHKIINSLESKSVDIDGDVYDVSAFDDLSVDEIKELTEEFKCLLNAIKFNLSSENVVLFDDTSYDFVINGKSRSQYGKGSRAVIYACFVISLAEYLAKRNMPQIGFVLLDSPLVTHFDKKRDIKKTETNPISLTDAFYQYLISASLNVQIILIENKGPTFTVNNNDDVHLIDFNFDGSTGIFPKRPVN
jgi:hypothetical protein